ncbi:MAG TPA: hypothetical protein DIT09_13395 [Glutamicibacter sp.]|uniref:DUF1016 N-terminal domain-containing protein n=1 Tax=Glutamicibacter TaxID=1742989 RepID=UPI000EE30E18|nr:hypothetical protein [Glutamicibacter sp.]
MGGLSRSNQQYMRVFAAAWHQWDPNLPQPVGHLPWGNIRVLLDKKLATEAREWYAPEAIRHG